MLKKYNNYVSKDIEWTWCKFIRQFDDCYHDFFMLLFNCNDILCYLSNYHMSGNDT